MSVDGINNQGKPPAQGDLPRGDDARPETEARHEAPARAVDAFVLAAPATAAYTVSRNGDDDGGDDDRALTKAQIEAALTAMIPRIFRNTPTSLETHDAGIILNDVIKTFQDKIQPKRKRTLEGEVVDTEAMKKTLRPIVVRAYAERYEIGQKKVSDFQIDGYLRELTAFITTNARRLHLMGTKAIARKQTSPPPSEQVPTPAATAALVVEAIARLAEIERSAAMFSERDRKFIETAWMTATEAYEEALAPLGLQMEEIIRALAPEAARTRAVEAARIIADEGQRVRTRLLIHQSDLDDPAIDAFLDRPAAIRGSRASMRDELETWSEKQKWMDVEGQELMLAVRAYISLWRQTPEGQSGSPLALRSELRRDASQLAAHLEGNSTRANILSGALRRAIVHLIRCAAGRSPRRESTGAVAMSTEDDNTVAISSEPRRLLSAQLREEQRSFTSRVRAGAFGLDDLPEEIRRQLATRFIGFLNHYAIAAREMLGDAFDPETLFESPLDTRAIAAIFRTVPGARERYPQQIIELLRAFAHDVSGQEQPPMESLLPSGAATANRQARVMRIIPYDGEGGMNGLIREIEKAIGPIDAARFRQQTGVALTTIRGYGEVRKMRRVSDAVWKEIVDLVASGNPWHRLIVRAEENGTLEALLMRFPKRGDVDAWREDINAAAESGLLSELAHSYTPKDFRPTEGMTLHGLMVRNAEDPDDPEWRETLTVFEADGELALLARDEAPKQLSPQDWELFIGHTIADGRPEQATTEPSEERLFEGVIAAIDYLAELAAEKGYAIDPADAFAALSPVFRRLRAEALEREADEHGRHPITVYIPPFLRNLAPERIRTQTFAEQLNQALRAFDTELDPQMQQLVQAYRSGNIHHPQYATLARLSTALALMDVSRTERDQERMTYEFLAGFMRWIEELRLTHPDITDIAGKPVGLAQDTPTRFSFRLEINPTQWSRSGDTSSMRAVLADVRRNYYDRLIEKVDAYLDALARLPFSIALATPPQHNLDAGIDEAPQTIALEDLRQEWTELAEREAEARTMLDDDEATSIEQQEAVEFYADLAQRAEETLLFTWAHGEAHVGGVHIPYQAAVRLSEKHSGLRERTRVTLFVDDVFAAVSEGHLDAKQVDDILKLRLILGQAVLDGSIESSARRDPARVREAIEERWQGNAEEQTRLLMAVDEMIALEGGPAKARLQSSLANVIRTGRRVSRHNDGQTQTGFPVGWQEDFDRFIGDLGANESTIAAARAALVDYGAASRGLIGHFWEQTLERAIETHAHANTTDASLVRDIIVGFLPVIGAANGQADTDWTGYDDPPELIAQRSLQVYLDLVDDATLSPTIPIDARLLGDVIDRALNEHRDIGTLPRRRLVLRRVRDLIDGLNRSRRGIHNAPHPITLPEGSLVPDAIERIATEIEASNTFMPRIDRARLRRAYAYLQGILLTETSITDHSITAALRTESRGVVPLPTEMAALRRLAQETQKRIALLAEAIDHPTMGVVPVIRAGHRARYITDRALTTLAHDWMRQRAVLLNPASIEELALNVVPEAFEAHPVIAEKISHEAAQLVGTFFHTVEESLGAQINAAREALQEAAQDETVIAGDAQGFADKALRGKNLPSLAVLAAMERTHTAVRALTQNTMDAVTPTLREQAETLFTTLVDPRRIERHRTLKANANAFDEKLDAISATHARIMLQSAIALEGSAIPTMDTAAVAKAEKDILAGAKILTTWRTELETMEAWLTEAQDLALILEEQHNPSIVRRSPLDRGEQAETWVQNVRDKIQTEADRMSDMKEELKKRRNTLVQFARATDIAASLTEHAGQLQQDLIATSHPIDEATKAALAENTELMEAALAEVDAIEGDRIPMPLVVQAEQMQQAHRGVADRARTALKATIAQLNAMPGRARTDGRDSTQMIADARAFLQEIETDVLPLSTAIAELEGTIAAIQQHARDLSAQESALSRQTAALASSVDSALDRMQIPEPAGLDAILTEPIPTPNSSLQLIEANAQPNVRKRASYRLRAILDGDVLPQHEGSLLLLKETDTRGVITGFFGHAGRWDGERSSEPIALSELANRNPAHPFAAMHTTLSLALEEDGAEHAVLGYLAAEGLKHHPDEKARALLQSLMATLASEPAAMSSNEARARIRSWITDHAGRIAEMTARSSKAPKLFEPVAQAAEADAPIYAGTGYDAAKHAELSGHTVDDILHVGRMNHLPDTPIIHASLRTQYQVYADPSLMELGWLTAQANAGKLDTDFSRLFLNLLDGMHLDPRSTERMPSSLHDVQAFAVDLYRRMQTDLIHWPEIANRSYPKSTETKHADEYAILFELLQTDQTFRHWYTMGDMLALLGKAHDEGIVSLSKEQRGALKATADANVAFIQRALGKTGKKPLSAEKRAALLAELNLTPMYAQARLIFRTKPMRAFLNREYGIRLKDAPLFAETNRDLIHAFPETQLVSPLRMQEHLNAHATAQFLGEFLPKLLPMFTIMAQIDWEKEIPDALFDRQNEIFAEINRGYRSINANPDAKERNRRLDELERKTAEALIALWTEHRDAIRAALGKENVITGNTHAYDLTGTDTPWRNVHSWEEYTALERLKLAAPDLMRTEKFRYWEEEIEPTMLKRWKAEGDDGPINRLCDTIGALDLVAPERSFPLVEVFTSLLIHDRLPENVEAFLHEHYWVHEETESEKWTPEKASPEARAARERFIELILEPKTLIRIRDELDRPLADGSVLNMARVGRRFPERPDLIRPRARLHHRITERFPQLAVHRLRRDPRIHEELAKVVTMLETTHDSTSRAIEHIPNLIRWGQQTEAALLLPALVFGWGLISPELKKAIVRFVGRQIKTLPALAAQDTKAVALHEEQMRQFVEILDEHRSDLLTVLAIPLIRMPGKAALVPSVGELPPETTAFDLITGLDLILPPESNRAIDTLPIHIIEERLRFLGRILPTDEKGAMPIRLRELMQDVAERESLKPAALAELEIIRDAYVRDQRTPTGAIVRALMMTDHQQGSKDVSPLERALLDAFIPDQNRVDQEHFLREGYRQIVSMDRMGHISLILTHSAITKKEQQRPTPPFAEAIAQIVPDEGNSSDFTIPQIEAMIEATGLVPTDPQQFKRLLAKARADILDTAMEMHRMEQGQKRPDPLREGPIRQRFRDKLNALSDGTQRCLVALMAADLAPEKWNSDRFYLANIVLRPARSTHDDIQTSFQCLISSAKAIRAAVHKRRAEREEQILPKAWKSAGKLSLEQIDGVIDALGFVPKGKNPRGERMEQIAGKLTTRVLEENERINPRDPGGLKAMEELADVMARLPETFFRVYATCVDIGIENPLGGDALRILRRDPDSLGHALFQVHLLDNRQEFFAAYWKREVDRIRIQFDHLPTLEMLGTEATVERIGAILERLDIFPTNKNYRQDRMAMWRESFRHSLPTDDPMTTARMIALINALPEEAIRCAFLLGEINPDDPIEAISDMLAQIAERNGDGTPEAMVQHFYAAIGEHREQILPYVATERDLRDLGERTLLPSPFLVTEGENDARAHRYLDALDILAVDDPDMERGMEAIRAKIRTMKGLPEESRARFADEISPLALKMIAILSVVYEPDHETNASGQFVRHLHWLYERCWGAGIPTDDHDRIASFLYAFFCQHRKTILRERGRIIAETTPPKATAKKRGGNEGGSGGSTPAGPENAGPAPTTSGGSEHSAAPLTNTPLAFDAIDGSGDVYMHVNDALIPMGGAIMPEAYDLMDVSAECYLDGMMPEMGMMMPAMTAGMMM